MRVLLMLALLTYSKLSLLVHRMQSAYTGLRSMLLLALLRIKQGQLNLCTFIFPRLHRRCSSRYACTDKRMCHSITIAAEIQSHVRNG
jgi:hypothetical protein